MRIRQIYTSPGLSNFESRMHQKYQLSTYTDPHQPAIFYGVFSASPPLILNHKSLAVILWAGTDTLRLSKAYAEPEWKDSPTFKRIAESKYCKHICRSACLQQDFDSVGLPSRFVRVSPVISCYFSPTVLGSDVYCYGVARKPEKYGGEWLEKLKIDFPNLKFRDHCLEHTTCLCYEQMNEVYRKCFLGLRLTVHDGLPNTVLELGLMGRKCVFNGDLPNGISYNTYEDVKKIVENEQQKIGQNGDEEIANSIRSLLNISDDWLNTEWYE